MSEREQGVRWRGYLMKGRCGDEQMECSCVEELRKAERKVLN